MRCVTCGWYSRFSANLSSTIVCVWSLAFSWQPKQNLRSFVLLLPLGTVSQIHSKTLLCHYLVSRIALRHFSHYRHI